MTDAANTEIDRFYELVQLEGHTTARAAAALVSEGYPERGTAFWQAERRRFNAEMRQFERELAECITPDGEIVGFRE
tara:strand:+ start:470 stop:700 length:231 start_codon:yes stop_codon:yes gene_type:complete